MKIHGATKIGVALAAFALLASACSSSKSSTSTTPGTSGSSGAKPTGSPIVIGNIGSYSGPQGSTFASGKTGIQAWAAAVNDAGGINGHPIKLIVKDDVQNPTTALSQVKELIAAKVVAIVSDQSSEDTQWAPLVNQAGIPVVGGFGINIPLATNPDFFPSGTNVFASTYANQVNAKAVGSKFGVLYCAEAPQCQILSTLSKAISTQLGVQIPITASVSATAADYTALCQQIKNSGVQSYVIGSGAATVLRVAKACWDQGVKATQQVTGGLDDAWLKEPAFNGATAVNDTFPFFDNSTPATQAFQTAMTKFGGGANGANAADAWVAGKLFEKAVSAIPSGTAITSASIKTGLYSLNKETLGGLSAPLTYTKDQPTLVNCWFTSKIEDGKRTEPKGLQTDCAPDQAIGAIAKAVAGGH